METHSHESADEIIKRIIANGAVDLYDVRTLERQVRSDWIVDRREVEELFRMNHAIGDHDEDCPAWTDFFVATASRLIVLDLETPGEIDKNEGDWLEDLLDRYSVGNQSEKKLLDEIRMTAKKISGGVSKRIKPF